MTLEEKIEKIQELAKRRDKIKIFLDSPNRALELWVGDNYEELYLEIEDTGETEETELNEYIDDYFKKELEKVDKKLNELFK